MQSSFYYALKVWATGFLLSPCMMILPMMLADIEELGVKGSLEILSIFVLYGCVLSVPSFALFWLSCKMLLKNRWHSIKIKSLLSITGIVLTLIAFCFGEFLGVSLEKDMIVIPLLYGSVITAAIWIFKLPQRTEVNDELPIPTYPDFK